MKTNVAWLGALLLAGHLSAFAQDKRPMQLEEVIQLATQNSTESKIANSKVTGRQLELEVAKNNRLPDIKLSGQFMGLTDADVKMRIPSAASATSPIGNISVNQVILGSATITQPIFTGNKIKNGVLASENAVKLESYLALNTKEQLAQQAVKLYLSLYKAQQTEILIEENIKRYSQQVSDFKAMEQNGLIARNDLLKAQLQLSNYQVSQQEAHKNVRILNYQLVNFLKLQEGTEIEQIKLDQSVDFAAQGDLTVALQNRYDVKALETQEAIALNQVDIAKAAYYSEISRVGYCSTFRA